MVQIFAGDAVAATHVKRLSGRGTDFAHYPPEKVAFAMRTPTWCRNTAAQVGQHCVAVIAELMSDNAIHHLRSAQGILGLREKNGPERLKAASARALQVGDPSYRTIKGILAAGAEHATDTGAAPSADATVPAFLRGPDQFDTAEQGDALSA